MIDDPSIDGIIGSSPQMQDVYRVTRKVAPSSATVLLTGETGTGKELIARALHELSSRASGPFIRVNCGALSESLLESELFGHIKGAFTSAIETRTGRFEAAHGGTVFLDEINSVSYQLQVKLLRVLQDREFEPVGGTQTHKVDVRLVLATNQNLEDAVRRGEFREDLYYRINVITLTQPALRERMGDIPLLVDHYLKHFNAQTGRKLNGIDDLALHAFQQYHWPGNVRELVNVIERAVVLCKHDRISAVDLPEKMFMEDEHYGSFDAPLGGASLKKALTTPERQLIIQALESNGWNRQNTARALGINRTTLYKKMKKYDIDFETVYKHA